MVLIALAIVFAGLGAMSLSSSDDDTETVATASSSTTTAAAPTTTVARTSTDTAAAATTEPVTATTASTTTVAPAPPPPPAVDRAVPVRVLNNSLVPGLAARTATQLQTDGWANVTSGNYSGGTVAKTTVYYGDSPGEREAAQAIAQELGATAEPKTGGPGDTVTGVIVILTGG
nr:LytR C-terminal domain-containing protein [Nocardia bovistercoris]